MRDGRAMSQHNGQPRFDDRVDHALEDGFLQTALRRAQDQIRPKRERAAEDMVDWEGWREHADAVRSHTVAHLDHYLEEFARNVEERGGKVFFAATADEASAYVEGLVREKGARRIVKSKSMVSEEIHLNAVLQRGGAEVVETDLGEYIIQLAEETPSHIIIPAIHKTRDQVRDIFAQAGGQGLTSDSQQLTWFARARLREKFLTADLGISGCNFAVAATGSVVLVSNEGNARLSTTLPRTHVVIMGMERIVPDWESLDPVLSMLPRAATGQRTTSYVTAITGPRRAADRDGPEELHVVIVDNGRSQILGGEYQKVLNCIRCGACLNVCPVYRHIGGHAYGGVYSGPIGAVLTPLLDGLEKWQDLPFASSLCGACQEVCPARVPLADALLSLRRDVVQGGIRPTAEKLAFHAFGAVAKSPVVYDRAIRLASPTLRFWQKDGRIEKGPGPMKKWTDTRSFPAPPSQTFRRWWEAEESGSSSSAGKG